MTQRYDEKAIYGQALTSLLENFRSQLIPAVLQRNRQEMKTQPIRTCLGCHKRFPKNQLLKFVLQEGIVVFDSKRTGQGRSAYCCNNKNCLRIFARHKRKLSRAFRVQDCKISDELED